MLNVAIIGAGAISGAHINAYLKFLSGAVS